MRRTGVALLVGLVLVAGAPAAGATPVGGGGGASVVVVGSLVTVRPRTHPAGTASASLFAARNEFESFQVVVRAGGSPLAGVRVGLRTALHGPGGTIPGRNVTISREAYVDLRRPSDLEGGRGRWPDPLVPARDPFYLEPRNAFPVTVPAGENRTAWVDVLVPSGQAPGRYEGSLSVTASGGFAVTVPVHLLVLRLTLPSTATLGSAFGMEWNAECLAHTGGHCFADEAKEWRLKTLYVRAALEDRITITDPAFRPPFGDGRPGTESAAFRRYILPMLQGRSPRDPAGLWTNVRLPGARLTAIQVRGPSQLRAWKQEAEHGGFVHRAFLYACDEPGTDPAAWSACKHAARAGRAAWPGLRVLVTANIWDSNRFGATGLIDLIVPVVNAMQDKPSGGPSGSMRWRYDAFVRAGPPNEVWTYTSCQSHGCVHDDSSDPYWAGWPSYVVDQPGSEHRAMGFLAFEYRTTGDLYYDVDHRLSTAWTDEYAFGGNGDGTLFYPGRACAHGVGCVGGRHDIPIESIRLKRIRDGREDYEVLRFLAAHGRRAQALRVVRGLFPTMFETDVTQAAFDGARTRLARLVAGVTGGPRP